MVSLLECGPVLWSLRMYIVRNQGLVRPLSFQSIPSLQQFHNVMRVSCARETDTDVVARPSL